MLHTNFYVNFSHKFFSKCVGAFSPIYLYRKSSNKPPPSFKPPPSNKPPPLSEVKNLISPPSLGDQKFNKPQGAY